MKTISFFHKMLVLFTGFIFLMIAFRYFYFHNRHFLFLGWNIVLAFIPYGLSSLFSKVNASWKSWVLFAGWILFFPNALYIVTDLVHLRENSIVPLWYDTILVCSAALMGLLIAFTSLYQAETFLAKKINIKYLGISIISILFICSFGVYLGRYQRWNSWDIMRDPLGILATVTDRLFFPLEHGRTWGTTVLLTVMYSFLFFTSRHMFAREIKNAG